MTTRLVSGMQQSGSAIHIYVYSLPDSFPSYIILLNVVPSVYIRALSLTCREKIKKERILFESDSRNTKPGSPVVMERQRILRIFKSKRGYQVR